MRGGEPLIYSTAVFPSDKASHCRLPFSPLKYGPGLSLFTAVPLDVFLRSWTSAIPVHILVWLAHLHRIQLGGQSLLWNVNKQNTF